MKVERVAPVPVLSTVRIELTPEEASALEYLFGQLSLNRIKAAMDKAHEIHALTLSLYFALFHLSHDN